MNTSRLAKLATACGLALICAVAAHGIATAADLNQIDIKDFMFQPKALTIDAGTTITWVNHDEAPHTVRSDLKLFASVAMDTDDKFSFTFHKPGTYHYICSIHPQMIGTIVVR